MFLKAVRFFILIGISFSVIQASASAHRKPKPKQKIDYVFSAPLSHLFVGLAVPLVGAASIFFGVAQVRVKVSDVVVEKLYPNLTIPNHPSRTKDLASAQTLVNSLSAIGLTALAGYSMYWWLSKNKAYNDLHKQGRTLRQWEKHDPLAAHAIKNEHAKNLEPMPDIEHITVKLAAPHAQRTAAKYALAGATAAAYPSRVVAGIAQPSYSTLLTCVGSALGALGGALWGYSKSCNVKTVRQIIETNDAKAAKEMFKQHPYLDRNPAISHMINKHKANKVGYELVKAGMKKSNLKDINVARFYFKKAVIHDDAKRVEKLLRLHPFIIKKDKFDSALALAEKNNAHRVAKVLEAQ